ncbi:TetR/AcrR family transcriptional regulator [Paenibacillus agricola]|uniref:TetR/AcrR family transcriptional regulator n=1 Tax=Paenibacillus agricola TaxID=2716264 RepID=A0ABX0J6W4_9BACL|nr:TetR/AcrR family transcriptional regulator [Paenibacillus agricola]NHN31703.1 TetR/AcrR family transcriptional regulator [Paenibacillus agricola]
MNINENMAVKTKILTSAKKLFAELGYEGTSVRRICEEAGVSLPLVSYHFGGKENVFLEIIEPLHNISYPPETDDPVTDLQNYFKVIIDLFKEEEVIAQILRQELVMNSPRSDKIIPLIRNVINKLKSILENGEKKGVFHFQSITVTTRFIVVCMTAFVKRGTLETLLDHIEEKETDSAKELFEFVFKGIQKI